MRGSPQNRKMAQKFAEGFYMLRGSQDKIIEQVAQDIEHVLLQSSEIIVKALVPNLQECNDGTYKCGILRRGKRSTLQFCPRFYRFETTCGTVGHGVHELLTFLNCGITITNEMIIALFAWASAQIYSQNAMAFYAKIDRAEALKASALHE